MLLDLAMLTLGCGLLFYGGDWLVDGVLQLAARLRVPHVIVAFVVMGFGTSAPELFVSVNAMLAAAPDIALGNVVGSNIANLLLVMALAGLIAPLATDASILRTDGTAMLASALGLGVAAMDGVVSRLDATVLILGMLIYLGLRWRRSNDHDASVDALPTSLGMAVIVSGAALFALAVGAHVFIDAAISIAHRLGLSEGLIGLSVVAIGTSLPEMAACVTAALRRQSAMILGGVLGSNVFNGTIVLGAAAWVTPVPIGADFAGFWIPAMIGASVISILFLRTGFTLSRREATIMLMIYVGIFAMAGPASFAAGGQLDAVMSR